MKYRKDKEQIWNDVVRSSIGVMSKVVTIAEVLPLTITDTEPAMVFVTIRVCYINITVTSHCVELTIVGAGIKTITMLMSLICVEVATHGLVFEALCGLYIRIFSLITQYATAWCHWGWGCYIALDWKCKILKFKIFILTLHLQTNHCTQVCHRYKQSHPQSSVHDDNISLCSSHPQQTVHLHIWDPNILLSHIPHCSPTKTKC